MILTPTQYSQKFLLNKKKVSAMTVKRRCAKNMLPINHKAQKTPGGHWLIVILED
jgi:hypothetical protein